MNVGLIVNPGAARNGSKGATLVKQLKTSQAHIRHLDSFDSLPSILSEFAAAEIGLLAISSGDGTVQAVLTELGERSPFHEPPKLLLLPHGTTNMTAADLGFRARGIAAQAAFLASPGPARETRRHALRVANPADGYPRQGMFFGAGAIPVAARYCQAHLNRRGLGGDLAPGLTLAAALAGAAFGKDLGIDRPYELTVDGQAGAGLLLLATTLERLLFGSKPFWGEGDGAIGVTRLPYPFQGKLRWLGPLLYGGPARAKPPGAQSFRAKSFQLNTNSGLLLDGECFDPPPNEPLRVETGVALTYVLGP